MTLNYSLEGPSWCPSQRGPPGSWGQPRCQGLLSHSGVSLSGSSPSWTLLATCPTAEWECGEPARPGLGSPVLPLFCGLGQGTFPLGFSGGCCCDRLSRRPPPALPVESAEAPQGRKMGAALFSSSVSLASGSSFSWPPSGSGWCCFSGPGRRRQLAPLSQ